jgi:hypothetical protein
MSLGLDILSEGVAALEGVHGDKLTHERTGTEFVGTIESAPPIDPNLSLGPDPRPKDLLHVSQSADPGLAMDDIIVLPAGERMKVTQRELSPGDFMNRYWLVQVVEGIDT